jgi:hypothetical protein
MIGSLARADGLTWRAHAHVDKYSADQEAFAIARARREDLLLLDRGRVTNLGALLKRFTGPPEFGEIDVAGNLLTTVGLNLITQLLIGTTTVGSIKNAQAIVGVGATATAATVGDTALGANAGSAWYQQADGSNPTQANGVITMLCTFATGNANFAWNEWCWASTTTGTITAGATLASVSSGTEVMWNHKIASLGTKTSAASWAFTTTVTLA